MGPIKTILIGFSRGVVSKHKDVSKIGAQVGQKTAVQRNYCKRCCRHRYKLGSAG